MINQMSNSAEQVFSYSNPIDLTSNAIKKEELQVNHSITEMQEIEALQ